MSRTTQPKGKIVRYFGENIFNQPKLAKVLAKKPYGPGAHGQKLRRRRSDYAAQLKEKQKLKAIYDMAERPFRRYYQTARKTQTATGTKLLQILESRLDNVVFRAGFAPTRAASRQLVNHGHINVDSQKVTTPSYLVKPGQVVSLAESGQKIPLVKALLASKDVTIPKWLKRQAIAAKIERWPERDEIDVNIQEQLIVEFYSR